ncbi:hypothetical protein EDD16DRAFT_1592907, partial [Pisolithus croceorrhizus]
MVVFDERSPSPGHHDQVRLDKFWCEKLWSDTAWYEIMYLTCRTIGHADSTRDYLKGSKQDTFQLAERFAIPGLDRVIAWLH